MFAPLQKEARRLTEFYALLMSVTRGDAGRGAEKPGEEPLEQKLQRAQPHKPPIDALPWELKRGVEGLPLRLMRDGRKLLQLVEKQAAREHLAPRQPVFPLNALQKVRRENLNALPDRLDDVPVRP